MENIHKQFLDSLVEAEKLWASADHLVFVTLPVVKDQRLLIRALENLYKAVAVLISTILKFEYLYKRINLSKDTKKNLEVFFSKCVVRYGIEVEEIGVLRRLMVVGKKHKESGFEFSKNGKIVILDDSLGMVELTVGEMKDFIRVSRKLLENTNSNFSVFV
jgi:hypothetical protein